VSSAPTFAAPAIEVDDGIARSIERAIQYADRFDQAVSTADIFRYLDTPSDAVQVASVLERNSERTWHSQDGMHCLRGREALFAETRERAQRSRIIWLRARQWAAIMAHLPCVRMIAVTGSLAMNNMRPEADIDYLVVTTPGRVWTTRLMLVGLVRLARILNVELCPNYVLSTEVMHLDDQTFFTARELAQMVPVFGLERYRTMMQLNAWMLHYLPAASAAPAGPPIIRLSPLASWLKAAGERLLRSATGRRLEDWERQRKIERLQRQPGAVAPNVILSAEQCKGHFRGTHRDRDNSRTYDVR
jgi:predicted nucleotidyltransferase